MRERFSPLTPGVLPGRRTQQGITEGLEEGVVVAVSADGVTFKVPRFGEYLFGPAPWCSRPWAKMGREHSQGTTYDDDQPHDMQPRIGHRCLVGFAGPDRLPWVLGWWGEPDA